MSGSKGHLTIELAKYITVDGVSVEHASRMITPDGSSAPKEFQVCVGAEVLILAIVLHILA